MRLIRKARKLRIRIGGNDDLFAPLPKKPKNMQWETYWKLRKKTQEASELSLSIALKKLGVIS